MNRDLSQSHRSELNRRPREIGNTQEATNQRGDSILAADHRTVKAAEAAPTAVETATKTQSASGAGAAVPVALDRHEYRRQILIAYATARALRSLQPGLLLAAIETAHAIGAFVDPRLYRDNAQAMREDEAMLRILADAKRELDALPWPAPTPSEFITPPAAQPCDELDATRVAFGGRP